MCKHVAVHARHRNRPDDQHSAIPKAVTIEQTHNRAGGRVLSMRYLASLKAWAAANKLALHMDGARVFNAAQSLGVLRRRVIGVAFPVALPSGVMPSSKITEVVCCVCCCRRSCQGGCSAGRHDDVLPLQGALVLAHVCVTEGVLRPWRQRAGVNISSHSNWSGQGLGAPVGSIIVGSAEFIHKAHRMRKLLGGAMRQVAHAVCWRTALHVYVICTNKHTKTQTASRLTSRLVHDPEHCARFQVAVLAAPGLVALRDTPPLLAEDHANAQLIAHGGDSQVPLMTMALSSLRSVSPQKRNEVELN